MRGLLILVAALSCSCGADSSTTTTAPSQATANVVGNWLLQTNASASCASRLPADSRNRSYLVTATQIGTSATFAQIAATNPSISVTLVGFVSGSQIAGPLSIVDGILVTDVFAASGTFTGTASGTTITGTLNGVFQNLSVGGTCTAADHQITFAKK